MHTSYCGTPDEPKPCPPPNRQFGGKSHDRHDQPSVFGTFAEPNGTSVNTVRGQSEITLKAPDDALGTILLPSVPSGMLHLTHGLKFMHG
jgi:hypothetical protein